MIFFLLKKPAESGDYAFLGGFRERGPKRLLSVPAAAKFRHPDGTLVQVARANGRLALVSIFTS